MTARFLGLIFILLTSAQLSLASDVSCLLPLTAAVSSVTEFADALKCHESSVVSAKDSPSLKYFQDLEKKGMLAPIEDFLKLWYPKKEKEIDDAYFFKCQKSPFAPITEKVNAQHELAPECKPDVFYSWGPEDKLQNMERAMKDGEAWTSSPNPRASGYGIGSSDGKPTSLFMAITPFSSSAYGEYAVRIKVKKATRMTTVGWHPEPGTLDFNPVERFQDVVMNDASVIESWSYGTPDIYDELVRDVKQIASGKRAQLYAPKLVDANATGMKRLYHIVDRNTMDEDALKKRFLTLIGMILRGDGRIHYQKGACRNREAHYKTDRPTYFNPQ
jgi:hypothetical protein